MGNEQQSVYVMEVDMKEKPVEAIAREAALQIKTPIVINGKQATVGYIS